MAFSVLKSFLEATQASANDNKNVNEGEGSSSGSSEYFSPSMDNCILAPYNFNFS